jgi:hypothetical protein
MISVKERQKTGLRAGGTLAAQKPQLRQHEIQLFKVKQQLLNPQASSLSHSDQLRRLIMGKPKGGHSLMLISEAAELGDNNVFLFANELKGFMIDQDVGVVTYIA